MTSSTAPMPGRALVTRPRDDTAVALIDGARAVMRRNARTFSWAAPFLARDARDDAAVAYAFCRAVDDLADDAASDDERRAARAALRAVRARLVADRSEAPRGDGCADPVLADSLDEITRAYLAVAARRGIDETAAIELVDGALSDLEFRAPRDEAELLAYCHAVAGTVGLMMCAILGARGAEARRAAESLGMAMQLTNIARDVGEDAARGRVYLPATWRTGASGGWPAEAVERCLARADELYREAARGLSFLPWRARIGVVVAGRLYRAIGARVTRLGTRAWSQRAVVPWWHKLTLSAGAVVAALRSPRTAFGA